LRTSSQQRELADGALPLQIEISPASLGRKKPKGLGKTAPPQMQNSHPRNFGFPRAATYQPYLF
jgi:hypothetical protein